MKIFKPKFWEKNHLNLFAILLLPISIIIQILSLIKKKIIGSKNFDIPIICIGNIYLGGTGKTPLSIKIFEIISKRKKNPAIIRKFYKNYYDEINLIKKKISNLFVNSSRIKAIDQAIENKFDTIILDDGFQDYSVKKNLNILCFNEKQLIGNGHTIPSGPLRQNFNSIKDCQIIVINGKRNKDFENKIKNISNRINIFYSKYVAVNINSFKNKKLLAFAGIGNPVNFFNLLDESGLNVKKRISFPDHYLYSKKELEKLIDFAKKNSLEIITTEKDYFRLKNFNFKEIDYLSVKLEIFNENLLIQELKKYI